MIHLLERVSVDHRRSKVHLNVFDALYHRVLVERLRLMGRSLRNIELIDLNVTATGVKLQIAGISLIKALTTLTAFATLFYRRLLFDFWEIARFSQFRPHERDVGAVSLRQRDVI